MSPFSSIDKISFTPDVLILAADGTQLEIILRAMCFATGKMWTSKGNTGYRLRLVNHLPLHKWRSEFHYDRCISWNESQQIFPSGTILVSIPYDQLSNIIDGLQKIEWLPALYTEGREAHDRKFDETAYVLHQKLQAQSESE